MKEKKHDMNKEKVDVYNKDREKLNIIKSRDELIFGEYRISVHIWIVNSNNNFLVVKRSEKEDVYPGLWAQVGGGVKAGDDSITTVIKECREELGLEVIKEEIELIDSYSRTEDIVDVFVVRKDINIDELILEEDEIVEVKLVSFDEFENMIKNDKVVPSINPSYEIFKEYLNLTK